ncbi:WD40 repeat domain-containing protein, partial [bacterium]|nr:WD40 repeat domain-containing protein [bacterium]
LFLFFTNCFFAQSHISSQAHSGMITNLEILNSNDPFYFSNFTAGNDGFIVKWSEDNQGEHYQISDVGIKLIAVSPNGNDIAIYASDGGSVNRVEVWDWKNLKRKFFKRYKDAITSLEFSSKGTYLIVGTATVDGAQFIRTQNWTIVDKIKANTSIVNYIQTSSTEKTCVFYSPVGTLSYFNMQTGQLKEKLNIIRGLNQVVLYNNNIFLAGVKDDTIYVINAFKGNTVTAILANNPIILSNTNDSNLYYLEYDGRNNYELKMIENMEGLTVSNPRIIKTLKGPRGNSAICCGYKQNTNIVLGSLSGSIYRIDAEPSTSIVTMEESTNNIYSKIHDMTPAPSDFYFLTSNAIFKSSYDSGVVDKMAEVHNHTNIISYDDENVILWSKSTNNPIIMMNLSTKTQNTLFTPKSTLQTLKLSSIGEKKYLIAIESNSKVNLYDFTNNQVKEIYSGTGIQDAVLTDDGNLYIGKSASTNPKSPMICVNPETYETVPLAVTGNVCYALSTQGSVIYGINLQEDNNTYVFSYNTKTKKVTNILKFAEEDAEAFTYLYNNNLFTNIGRNKVYCYNISTKQRFSYERTASIPLSISQNKNRVVILNDNGCISWFGDNSA